MLRQKFLWFTVLLLLAGLLNYWCRKALPDSYADLLSYNGLYGVPDQLRITAIERAGEDSLSIRFDGAVVKEQNHFEVYMGGVKWLDRTAPFLTMQPNPTLKEYTIRINSADSIHINIEFSPSSDISRPAVAEITTAALIRAGNLHQPGDWSRDGPLTGKEERAKEIRHYLLDSMKIHKEDPSDLKVIKISKYILSVTAGKYGTPSDSMDALAPIDQLNCVRTGRSRLYCGNYGRIFAFFSDKAGVPARYIESGTLSKGILNGPHVVNEVYLKEARQWAYVDLTDGIVFVKKSDRFLNSLDIQRLLRYGPDDSTLVAWQYHKDSLTRKDSLAPTSFGKASFFAKNAFNPGNKFTFYYGPYGRLAASRGPVEKLAAIFYTSPWYALYSDNSSPSNGSFYIRLYSTYIFGALFACWILMALYRLAALLSIGPRIDRSSGSARDSRAATSKKRNFFRG